MRAVVESGIGTLSAATELATEYVIAAGAYGMIDNPFLVAVH